MWPPRGDHTSPPGGSWSDRRRALGLLVNTRRLNPVSPTYRYSPFRKEARLGKPCSVDGPRCGAITPPSAGLGHWRLLAASPDP
jgi:hypothetical protein